MLDPYHDLLIFDWAMALASTVLASRLLQVPQSTISRRMRAFQAEHRLTIRRSGGGLKVLSPLGYLDDLRCLAQRFRLLHSELRWSAHPIWAEQLQTEDDHLGLYLNLQVLPPEDLEHDDIDPLRLLEQRLLDSYLDATLCQTPDRSSWPIGLQGGSQHGASLAPSARGPVQLGAFAAVQGMAEALTAMGWTVLTGSPLDRRPALTLIPRNSGQPPAGIVPIGLHVKPLWLYSPSLQASDPHTAGGIKQFEAHLAIALDCLNDGSQQVCPPQEQIQSDPLFTFSPLP